MDVQSAAVIGAGTMGSEIAWVISAAGVPVLLMDVDAVQLQRGLAHARSVYARQVQRGRMTAEEAERLAQLIQITPDYSGLAGVDFVVEAVPERLALKQQVFADLEAAVRPEAVLASNTSSIPISEISQNLRHRERVVGFHFFNPAAVMRLIEVVQAPATSEETVQTAMAFAERLKKLPVRLKECPGFLVNRILLCAMLEAMRFQEETGADYAAIDAALKAGAGVPMGPFTLGDMLGLDVVLDVAEVLERAYGDRFRAPENLRRVVAAGRYGAKTGGGFYPPEPASPPGSGEGPGVKADAPLDAPAVVERFLGAQLAEAGRCLDEGVATAEAIDTAMQAGAGLPVGPLHRADEDGLDVAMAKLERLAAQHGSRFTPPAALRQRVAGGRLGRKTGEGFFTYPDAR